MQVTIYAIVNQIFNCVLLMAFLC